jgi:outer membrane murein-binding lipoprotein Lpp
MATTYYGAMPNKETLRPGDVIQYDNNVTFQHPDIQELFKQNSVIPYYDKSGAATGAQVQTPYIKPTTTFSPTGEQINQPVDLGAYGFTEPSGRYVIDSESNRLRGITPDMEQAAAEKARAQGLIPYFKSANTKGGSKKEPDLMTTFNDLLEAQKGAIEQQRQQNISNINSRSSSAIQGTKDVAGRSSGALQRILGRAGGFTTTAGGEAVASQANTLNQQVQALESERERSIAQANLAASTGNAALLDKAMSNMLAIEQATREKQQQQQKNLMDYLGLVNEEKTLKQGEKTPDIKEYEYAVAQGYTGSWQDYQNSLKGESKLMTLKAGDVVYDPKTGQKVYEVPDTEKGDVQVIGNADMGYFQYDSKTNGWKQIVTPQTKDPADDLLTKDELVAFNMPAGSTWGDVQGMTPKTELTGEGKTRLFVSIADKYQADSIVKTYDSAATTTAIADQIIADPNKATNQLKALYLLVKNLDPDSAVREGELSLANST